MFCNDEVSYILYIYFCILKKMLYCDGKLILLDYGDSCWYICELLINFSHLHSMLGLVGVHSWVVHRSYADSFIFFPISYSWFLLNMAFHTPLSAYLFVICYSLWFSSNCPSVFFIIINLWLLVHSLLCRVWPRTRNSFLRCEYIWNNSHHPTIFG